MSRLVKIPQEEFEKLKTDLKLLAHRKSELELIITVMEKLTPTTGLQNTIRDMLSILMNTLGGSNIILYYKVDGQWSSRDIMEEEKTFSGANFDDSLVRVALEEGTFQEDLHSGNSTYVSHEKTSGLDEKKISLDAQEMAPFLSQFFSGATWIFPLAVRGEIIGILKLEGVMLAFQHAKAQLLSLIHYLSLILYDEIANYSNLKISYDHVRTINEELTREVEERRQIEEELREERNKLQTILDTITDGINIKNADYEILFQNKVLLRQYGNQVGKKCYKVYQGLDQICSDCPVEPAFQDGQSHMVTRKICLPSGEIQYTEIIASPIRDAAGEITSCLEIMRNITERKKMEEKIIEAQKMDSIGNLAGGVAHDFNNMLCSIMGYVELLLLSEEDSQKRSHLEWIMKSARRSSDLTQKLLAFARHGKHLVQPVSINQLVEEVVGLLKRSIAKTIKIEINLKTNMDWVKGDPSQLHQVLLNLCVNGVESMGEKGRLTIQTQNTVVDQIFSLNHPHIKPGHHVLLSVQDTGCGIDEEAKPHIFEPFFSTKKDSLVKGTGLGLAMVYGIVKSHSGAIEVTSVVGQGTTFQIYLPRGEKKGNGKKIHPLPGGRGSGTILLVDDEPAIRMMAEDMMIEWGYTVLTASDGKKALAIYGKSYGEIDGVVLDMQMPNLGGKETFLQMKAINSEVKVLLSTGYGHNEQVQELLDLGVKALLPKPYHLSTLFQALKTLVGG